MNWAAVVVTMMPEHILLTGIVLLIAIEIGAVRRWDATPLSLVTLVLAAAAALALFFGGFNVAPFPEQLSSTPMPCYPKHWCLRLRFLLLMARDEFVLPQFHILLLSSLYGACVLLSSESFLVLFLGLELMSPVYAMVLLAYRRPESAEAALKYLVLGGTATATLLMGASLLYGSAGSLSLASFRDALASTDVMAQMAIALVIAAFFLKAAVVPFHAWAPDAYEAAAVPVTTYMAVVIKAGVLLAAVRLFGTAALSSFAVELLAWLPLASIVWGNLAAMRQQSLRRMIAYSSIAHAGYLFYAFLGRAPVASRRWPFTCSLMA